MVLTGLSQRAGHPRDRFYQLHGSLMDVKCTNTSCDYAEKENLKDPVCPALACDRDVKPLSSTPDVEAAASKLLSMTLKDGEQPTSTRPQFERRSNPLQEIIDSLAPIITDESK